MNKSFLSSRRISRLPFAFAPAAAALAALLAMPGCGGGEKQAEPVVTVQVAPAKKASIAQVISADGVIFPLQQAVITPKITSTIKKFYVQRGSRVKKGQLLAVLEHADLAAAAEQSKGEYTQAQAGYAAATGASIPEQIQKARLDEAATKSALAAQRKVFDSRKTLFEQGALPRRDLDSAEVALVQARTQWETAQKVLADLRKIGEREALKSASGQLQAAKGKYQAAAAQLGYSELHSPINGFVTDRPLYEGELATANQPVLTVQDTSVLIAKVHLTQADAAALHSGDAAELSVPGTDVAVPGRVSLISPAVDTASTTVEVWVQVAKKDSALKPGMSVQLSITAKTARDSIVVPASAVFKGSDGKEFMLIAGSDGKAHTTAVRTGIHSGDSVQILSGIAEGAQVIVNGGYGLPDNTQIKTAASGPASEERSSSSSGADSPAKD
jgi:multidrug efflux pump subunit AcrA (membrane-fusion protein)